MPKLTDKKKLCPRCGSPMMTKSETLKYCPVCHFTESSAQTTIKIKMTEETKEEERPEVELYQVSAGEVTEASRLESNFAYVIVDRKQNILWIWKGSKCSPGDAYKAGVQTTKLKSSLKMYSAAIKQIEEGDEPDNFPTIEDTQAKEEAERKAKEEAERKAKEEAERKAKEEAERKAKEEAERKAKEEAERKAKEEAERKAKEEAERKAKEEAERKAKEEAERKAKEEAEQKAKEEESTLGTENIWKKVAQNTKSAEDRQDTAPMEEDNELNQAISSLTLVRGIDETIAKKLYNANITSIMGLSLSDPDELSGKTDIDITVINELIGNAKDLLGLD